MEAMPPSAYPATMTFDPPERIANWRPLVQWILAIPPFIVLSALRAVVEVLAVISWFSIVLTGRLPDGIAKVQAMHLRYQTRLALYAEFDRPLTRSVLPVRTRLEDLQKPFGFSIYEGTNHAFHNDTGANYNRSAACDAWSKTVAFFQKHLQAS